MNADRSFRIGTYRARHYSAQRISGVFIGEHHAVEILAPNRRWRPVSYHPDLQAALADRERRLEGRQ